MNDARSSSRSIGLGASLLLRIFYFPFLIFASFAVLLDSIVAPVLRMYECAMHSEFLCVIYSLRLRSSCASTTNESKSVRAQQNALH